MKIAMLGHKRIPSREGGVEIVVEELSKRMVKLGHSVICYNRRGHHISGAEYDSDIHSKTYEGIQLVSVFTLNFKGLAAMTSSFFAAVRSAFSSADVVHFHAEGPSAMCWIPKLFGKRIVVTIHGLDWQRAKWGGFATWYLRQGEKMAVKKANEIIVLSRNVQKYFQDNYDRKTVFIPNGICKPVIKKANVITDKFDLKKDGYILFLGRIVPEKGVEYLIKAFKQVKTEKKLVIAGGTSDTDTFVNDMRMLAREDRRILFTGFIQGEMLEELYSNAYIYVLPSDLEGMPLSLLEAMSYGNCCLVSDIEECAEVVEDKAVLFPKGNVELLVEKLQMLCNDIEKVNNYKKNASEYICSRYNWDDVVEQTLNLY